MAHALEELGKGSPACREGRLIFLQNMLFKPLLSQSCSQKVLTGKSCMAAGWRRRCG